MKWGSGSLEYVLPLQWCAIIAYVDNVRPLMNIWREIMLKATICTQGQASFKHMLSCDKGSSNNASKLTFEWVLKDAHLKFMIRHLQLFKLSFFNSCYTSPHFYTSSRIKVWAETQTGGIINADSYDESWRDEPGRIINTVICEIHAACTWNNCVCTFA